MALDLTGIQNVGEFYSHHYLDALLEKDLKGLFTKWRLSDDNEDDDPTTDTPDKRLNRRATDYFQAKSQALNQHRIANRYQASHALHVALLESLGYPYDFDVQYLLDGRSVPTLCQLQRDGRAYLTIVETIFTDPDESPLDNHLLRQQFPPQADEAVANRAHEPWEEVLGELFRVDEPPRWILFLAGRFIYLLDRTKWGQGQYLLFDLDEIFGRRQRATLRAVAALLSRDALSPEDDGVPLHDTLDENSHKHAYAVSTDLKYGVRKAVELLANEYVWYQREIGKQALFSDEGLAQELTRECLTYLYRLLFLFYAEARSSELGLVPMQAEAYRTGYSLEALRDLEQVPLNTPQAQNGYFIDESLNTLFGLVNDGFPEFVMQRELTPTGEEVYDNYGFTIAGLRSPLFDRQATPRLSAAKFRNVVLQEILQLLSLSKEGRGRNSDRGRISYAQLGINQLGAVYEGLLSYSGFFAQQTLYEVKPAKVKQGDEMDQTYFIPESDLEKYKKKEFVYEKSATGKQVRKRYPKGSFIFRLAGRDREKSASYYTPEVLTECVVNYSLKELLGESPEDDNWKSADEILALTICEPAMGSGAFINEAINQLADAYLQRKQDELGETIPPDDYRLERQKVKAHLALHNAYGVDLNPMAAELAQVSLWLNIIYPEMPAPWFNARLAVGNSLIGVRREVYSAEDVLSGSYAQKAPTRVPLNQPHPQDSVYHWLLPDGGMAAFDGDKVIRKLAPDEVAAIKAWRKKFTKKITKAELRQMQALSDAADALWQRHVRERTALMENTRTPIALWGQPQSSIVNRQSSIEAKQNALDHLKRPTSPYRRLKLAMDYWCALWFWPIPQAAKLPARADFLADMAALLLGPEHDFERPPQQMNLLETQETPRQKHLAEVTLVDVDRLTETNERLTIVHEVQTGTYFYHWELAFAELFHRRGGFDLIVGNPPWVKPTFDESAVLSDFDPRIALRKTSSSEVGKLRNQMTDLIEVRQRYLGEFVTQTALQVYLGAQVNFSSLIGKANLYKCFINRGQEITNYLGVMGFLHPDGVYDDPNGGKLRETIFPQLSYHFQFRNELKLFPEIGNTKTYSINIYNSGSRDAIRFANISYLFHPRTIEECFNHDGLGLVPNLKNDADEWELKGHRRRIVLISEKKLAAFAKLFDGSNIPARKARLPLVHNREMANVLEKLANQERTLADISARFFDTQFWNETTAQKDGTIRRETTFPGRINDWILSGAHIFVANPYYQTPNAGCRSHRDYSEIDLVEMDEDFLPRTNYVPASPDSVFHSREPTWNGNRITKHYRQVFRAMLGPGHSERVLIGCIIPPDVTHINGIKSYTFDDPALMTIFSGLSSSIIYDFLIRSTGKQNLHELPNMLPIPNMRQSLRSSLVARTLRLNCLTVFYADLWRLLFDNSFKSDSWSILEKNRLSKWSNLTSIWNRSVGVRNPFERRLTLVEIDVLVSMALGLSIDELIAIYRVQSPVMIKYERRMLFDQRGYIVPVKTRRGELMVKEEDPTFPDMVPPFTPVDREADYRQAWAHFEKRLQENEKEA